MNHLLTCPRCGGPLSLSGSASRCERCLARTLLEPDELAEDSLAEEPVLRRLGDYELLEEIARGGMGVVFRARQTSLGREVAVKCLRDAWLATDEQRRRFQAEAASAARLRHPNIVAIHEIGDDAGQPFLVLDLIEGPNLEQLTRGTALAPRRAASLLATAARAVQHAHERGVLHRDLKPSNVLVDAQDQPHVTDFGLARPLDAESTVTQTGQVLGTPAYMAPEQVAGGGQAGPAVDIYGLGALLFHLLTGRPPFTGESSLQVLHHVVAQEPVSPRLLNPAVPQDLASICLKCLEKSPAARYASTTDLAEDLERYLLDRPTHARPAGMVERVRRWAGRRPALAGAMACAALFALLGFAGVFMEWRHAESLRALAETNAEAARASLYAADMNLVPVSLARHDLRGARELLRAHEPRPGDPDARGWEWWYYQQLCQGDRSRVLAPSRPTVLFPQLLALPQSQAVGVNTSDDSLEFWDLTTDQLQQRLTSQEVGPLWWTSVDREGRWMTTSDGERHLRLWSLEDPRHPRLVRTLESDRAMSIHAAKALLATAPYRKHPLDIPDNDAVNTTVRSFDPQIASSSLPESGDLSVFSRDGELLVTGSWKGTAKLWNTRDWSLRRTLPGTGNLLAMALSPDDRWLVTASWEGPVRLWDLAQGIEVGTLEGHASRVWSAAFSPDGQYVATGSGDQTLALWEVASRREVRRFRGHQGEVRGVVFSADGQSLASVSVESSQLRVWSLTPAASKDAALPAFSLPALSPDGRLLAAAGPAGMNVWDISTRQLWRTLPAEPNPVGFSADGRLLITATVESGLPITPNPLSGLKYWDLEQGRLDRELRFPRTNGVVSAVALSPDQRWLAAGEGEGRVILWDLARGESLNPLECGRSRVWNLVFSRSGRLLAAGATEPMGGVRLWDLQEGGRALDFNANGLAVAISPDERTLAVGLLQEIQFFDTTTGDLRQTLRGHRESLYWLAFSPDGRTLASACEDLRVWQVATGREVGSFQQSAPFLFSLFSPDGRTLVGGRLGEIHLWQASAVAR